MRIVRLLIACLLPLGVLAAVPNNAVGVPPQYYLALGDSLAAGYQPGGDTNTGYVYDIYNHLHALNPALQLINLGCDGETTGTMINGGCSGTPRTPYTTGSQLGDAMKYLHQYGSAVKYLTIDIGANDVDGCLPGGVPDPVCIAKGGATITTNLRTILADLRTADGGTLPLHKAGMTYYDPYLASWLSGAQGQAVAAATVTAAAGVNVDESTEYSGNGLHIADVFTAFRSTQFSPYVNTPPYGKLPLNVSNICKLTWMCSQNNIHANDAGYRLIAQTFLARL